MLDKIKSIRVEAEAFIASGSKNIEEFRVKMLGKKGLITQLFVDFHTIPNNQKRVVGKEINELKKYVFEKVNALRNELKYLSTPTSITDLSLPGHPYSFGTQHPITHTNNRLYNIFTSLGFSIAYGPELEDDWHVFGALNFPPIHPARDMQDTFFISKNPDVILRTHTSSVQVRVMEKEKPPIRVICPGRVFRNEAISARAHCIFHQVEGLYIDKNVSFADLRQTLIFFAQEIFGKNVKTRFRPSYFPFTEPSAEMDVSCNLCGGKGCDVCKHTGWLEILGCGMVDPNVLELCNIDSNIYTGYAFGMGIERMAMLKYQVSDLRHYFQNDVRFLNQFFSLL